MPHICAYNFQNLLPHHRLFVCHFTHLNTVYNPSKLYRWCVTLIVETLPLHLYNLLRLVYYVSLSIMLLHQHCATVSMPVKYSTFRCHHSFVSQLPLFHFCVARGTNSARLLIKTSGENKLNLWFSAVKTMTVQLHVLWFFKSFRYLGFDWIKRQYFLFFLFLFIFVK